MNGYRTSYVTPAIRVVDAPISKKSPEQWKAIVEYKALAFTHDNNYASIAYDLKSSRATFDPNLAGGNGGFRCPVGTRYGGQITDRYGRGCGWGVARRLVNAIGDTARRAERGLDKRRERRVQRRNARVGRQIGARGYTAPARAGRGMATRLEDFADRRDRRQRRGRGGVPAGPGVATRLEDFADRRDRRQGRGGRGVATRLEDFADRRDRRQGRGGRGVATRLEDFADRRDRRQGRGIATRLEDFADRRDRDQGVDVPERAPRTPKRPAKRPAAANRRSRRNEAVAETATNRPRPKRPSTSVAEVKPPQRRQRGPRVNVDDLNSAERMRLNDALDRERDVLNAKWKTRLGGEDPTPEKIRAYVEAREQRSKPAYVNTLKAMERDHAILNGENRLDQVNDLAPSVRKRIIGESIEDQGAARPQPPRAPRRPVKKRAVKKVAAKRPAKKAPAKKAPAKKAPATRPENSVPLYRDLDERDRIFVEQAIRTQGLDQTPRAIEEEIDGQAAIFNADGLDDLARVLENGARDDRRKARNAARPARERVAYQEIANLKQAKAVKLRRRAEVERVRAGNQPPSAPGAAGNAPEAPKTPKSPAAEAPAPQGRGRKGRLLGLYRNRPARRKKSERGNMGDAEGKSKSIKNPNIRSAQDAIDHIKNGGSLDRVPNEFWRDALQGNSSRTAVDPNSKYLEIKPDAGNIGLTRIYILRDSDGKPTDQGWVTKGAQIRDTAGEIGGQYMALRHGFPVEAAGWDGRDNGRRPVDGVVPFAILPFAANGIENGKLKKGFSAYDADIFDDLPDKAHPERFAHLLHNWMMGVADRNPGNGITYKIGNKPYVIPIDQGWAGRAITDSPWRYPMLMDGALDRGIPFHLSRIDAAERRKQAKALVDTYDEMLDRAEKVVAEGKAEFVRKTLNGVSATDRQAAKSRLEGIFDSYQSQVSKMRQSRTNILTQIIPDTDRDLIR